MVWELSRLLDRGRLLQEAYQWRIWSGVCLLDPWESLSLSCSEHPPPPPKGGLSTGDLHRLKSCGAPGGAPALGFFFLVFFLSPGSILGVWGGRGWEECVCGVDLRSGLRCPLSGLAFSLRLTKPPLPYFPTPPFTTCLQNAGSIIIFIKGFEVIYCKI